MWICTLTMLECSKVLADNRLGHLACIKKTDVLTWCH